MSGLMNFGSGGDLFDDDADAPVMTPSAERVAEVAEPLPDVVDGDGGGDVVGEDASAVPSRPMPDAFLGMPSFGEPFGSIASDGDDDEHDGDDGDDAAVDGDGPDEVPDADGGGVDEVSDTDETRDLSEARRASKRTQITRTVIVSLAGIAGVVLALGAFVLLMRSFGTPGVPAQGVSHGQADERSEGAEEQQKEEPKSGSAMLDEISDTGHGYGVTKLLADPTSETISLRGRIKNLGEDMREKVAIGVYLYDRDGSVIGVATGFVDRIEPGAVAEFVATSDVATADVANVALAEVRW